MGLLKKLLWRKVKKAFREKTGEELPIDMEQLQEVFKYVQKSHARNVINYNIILELGTNYIDKERFDEIMVKSIDTSLAEMEMIKSNVESIITTLAIVQGLNKAEELSEEPEENNDG